MRRNLMIKTAACAAAFATLGFAVAEGRGFLKQYRIRRLSGPPTMASPPFTPEADAPDCSLFPGVPEIIGDDFDPARYDQIDLGGNGRLVAFASAVTPMSIGVRAIVVLREGSSAEMVDEASGEDDQPSIDLDPFGWRVAFRGSEGVAGATGSDIYLHTVNRYTPSGDGETPTPVPYGAEGTRNLTGLDTATGEFARDPSLAARARTRSIKSGVTVRERDARVAFVSNGDLDKGDLPRNSDTAGKNPDNFEQVFVWREQDKRFGQITRNADPFATLARPTMSGNGRYVAFESDADLTPDAANPRDPGDVGNPDGVRQIFLWTESESGGRVRQLTWSDEDCLAPRITDDGRFVLFCSRGDLLPGGNPEGNFEIFRWRRRSAPERNLAQLTQTAAGHSVLPRPMRNPRRFVFYSTAAPPSGQTPFGEGQPQCGPKALQWSGGNVRLVFGVLDSENASLILQGEDPVLVGPPAAAYTTKIHFATNDPLLDPPEPEGEASLFRFHLGRATRYPRR